MRTTLCYWNQGSDPPETIAAEYLRILEAIGEAIGRSPSDTYLSIKLTALQFNYDLLQRIVERAQRSSIRLHFDSMACDTADATFAAIDRTRSLYGNLSCTIPARWRRSAADILHAIEMGVRVRIVKGEWPDTDANAPDVQSAFLELVESAAVPHATVAIATHDLDLGREAVRRAKRGGAACEIELLYGLPMRPMLDMAQTEGVPVRIYVPYGQCGLPYTLKEAVNNPRIIGRFVRDLLQSGH
jgi:proline dehydrogenase